MKIPFTPWKLVLLGLTFATSANAQEVIFSEIMYHPTGDNPEYVELLSNSSTPYDFANWKISGGVGYTFPAFDKSDPQASFLQNRERILVSSVSPEDLRAAYGIPDSVRIFGPWEGNVGEDGVRSSGFLSDQGERITLRDANGSLLSSVRYGDNDDWGAASDGAGHSLHVINKYAREDNFRNWSASAKLGGSPGTAETEEAGSSLSLSEALVNADRGLDWIEIHNSGSVSVDLDGYTLRSAGDMSGITAEDLASFESALSGTVASGAYLAVDVNLDIDTYERLFLADADGNVVFAHSFPDIDASTSYQTFPAGSSEWYSVAAASRGEANKPTRNDAIVINEILFDPISGAHGEFVELFNNSAEAVDLGGWELEGGLQYTFPSGYELAAGAYVAVVSDLPWFKETYGANVAAVGDFDGRLSNIGDLIRLIDANNNLADEVDYGVGGDWPTLADDKGSSMELVHPDMDNGRASAWRESDESQRSEFREYSVQKNYSRGGLQTPGGSSGDQELHFHLVGDGYVILEDVDLHRPKSLFNPNSSNIIENVDRESDTANSNDGWVTQGTHYRSYVDGNQIHVISEGRGDNRANRIECDIETLGSSADLELVFKARWVYGKARLIAQTVDHGWSHEFLIDTPENLGSPGAKNGAAQDQTQPQADDLMHSPPVPTSSDKVYVTARVASVTPLAKVEIAYIQDSKGGNTESLFRKWTRADMVDDGTGGDAVGGDGQYTGEISNFIADGNVIVFYVGVEDTNGQTRTLPKTGADSPALLVIDDEKRESDLRITRTVVSEYHLDQFGDRPGATHDYNFPYPSNHYKPCTMIFDEKYVHYNCEVRSAGSPWHEGERPNLQLKGKYKMPKSVAFRGRVKSTWDQDPTAGRMHNDRLTRYWLYLLGQPASDNEFIQFIVNDSRENLREEVEAPSDNGFMDRHWKDGSQGQMFRIDDEWQFTDRFDRSPRDARWDLKSPNGERAGRYHSEWMLRSREAEYDYGPIVDLFKMTTEDEFTQAQAERVIHTEQMAINIAVRGYIGDWDTFSIRRGKNGFMYRRSTDNKFTFVHWDSDLAFQNTSEAFLNGIGSSFRKWHTKPYVRRHYNYYLTELINNYGKGSKRLAAFFQAEEDSSSDYTVAVNKYETWNNARQSRTKTEIGSDNLGAPFSVTSEGGGDFSTDQNTITLEGSAASDVYDVILQGYPENYPKPNFEWTGETTWRMSEIVLAEGENSLQIRAADRAGVLLGSLFSPRKVDLTVTKTGTGSPVVALDSNPDSLNLGVSELLTLDASDSVDPEGDALTFEWQGPTSTAYALAPRPGATHLADASFNQPGLYKFTLTVTDTTGVKTSVEREAAVFGAGGFSSFSADRLESFWQADRLELKNPGMQPASYSLSDRLGSLTVAVAADTGAKPLHAVDAAFPWLHRALPSETDWSLHTKARLEGIQFGSFQVGLLSQVTTDGSPVYFAIGMSEGTDLTALKIDASGTSVLGSVPWDKADATVRLRRAGDQLHFEYRQKKVWQSVHAENLAAGTVANNGGPFVATDSPHTVRTTFDFVALIDPGTVSSLQKDLRVTEIMYHPKGGEQLEFLELQNIGAQQLNLSGAHFIEGIQYTFGEGVQLGAGDILLLVKDRDAFTAEYGADGITLAPGAYDGQLANGGETITLVDANELLIFSITYNDGGDWPEDADGQGASLELVDANEPINSPINWSASPVGGTPGVVNDNGGEPDPNDTDGDGIPNTWERQFGLNPAAPADGAGDADNDGWTALNEYLAGTNPNSASSALVLGIESSTTTVQLSFDAVAGRDYTVEVSNSLSANAQWSVLKAVPAVAPARVVMEEDGAPIGEERYYRVRVSPAP